MLTAPGTNSLIAALPRRQRARLLQACEPVEIMPDDVLCKAGQPYRYAYFPQVGVISKMSTLDSQKPLEMGLIGYEGMLDTGDFGTMDFTPLSRTHLKRHGTSLDHYQ